MNTQRKKKIMPLLASAWMGLLTVSTQGGQEEWQTDFAKAKEDAQVKNVPILADFTGSDWCGWCIKLESEVFSQGAFKSYAKTNLVLFLADYPQRKQLPAKIVQQNEKLAKQYKVEGFPTVLVLDATGREFARTGYRQGGSKAYVEYLQQLMARLKKDVGAPSSTNATPARTGNATGPRL